jgi:hypothetical protein
MFFNIRYLHKRMIPTESKYNKSPRSKYNSEHDPYNEYYEMDLYFPLIPKHLKLFMHMVLGAVQVSRDQHGGMPNDHP